MRARRTAVAAAALIALLFSSAPSVAQEEEPEPQPRVVVAVIEGSASNPYHEWFNAGGPIYGEDAPASVTPDVLQEFGIGEEHILEVTRTGNFQADFANDASQYESIEYGQPYWFEGTNIIGVSFEDEEDERLRPDGGSRVHAVGTTAAVIEANPEAIVVIVETPFAPLGVPGWGTAPLGEEWAFSHPAVDFISTSYGPPQSPPFGYHLTDSYTGVVENGKIHVGAAENSPALSPVDATSGPWWTIGMAGFGEHSHEGRELLSGSLPDFVADWTQELAYCQSCETGTRSVSGTSFATPRTAGTLSDILLQLRREAGHLRGIVTDGVDAPVMVRGGELELTNWEIRRALEEAAYYPTTGEWDPSAGSVPVPDPAPWTTAAWGVVTPDPEHGVVEQALSHLGVGDPPTRTKPAEACAFMTANIQARHAWWDLVAPFSQSSGLAEDPFEYCEL